MNERLVEANGLHTYYGSHHILHGVGFTIRRGEAIGLMGRNGMGKTTLLRTLLGLVRPREGSVHIRGRDATHEAPHRIARSGIALVPEREKVFPNLTVAENLLIPAAPGLGGAERKRQEAQVLQFFPKLEELHARTAGLLSGGERQMLGIAAALVSKPELLLVEQSAPPESPAAVTQVIP